MKYKFINDENVPKIYINAETYRIMTQLVKNCSDEIGWLALCEKKDNDYLIYGIEICEQECGAAHTDLMESGLQEIASRFIKEGRIDEMNNVRVWCHSHVNMGVTPSTQDETTFKEYYKECDDYFIRIIMNKREECNIALVDNSSGLLFEDLKYELVYEGEEKDIVDEIELYKKAIAELVTELGEKTVKFDDVAKTTAKDLIGKYVKAKTYNWNNNKYKGTTYYNNYYNSVKRDYTSNANSKKEKTKDFAYQYDPYSYYNKEYEENYYDSLGETFLDDWCTTNTHKANIKYYSGNKVEYRPLNQVFNWDAITDVAMCTKTLGVNELETYAFTEGYTVKELEDLYILCVEVWDEFEDQYYAM